jgi:hypothetical protein
MRCETCRHWTAKTEEECLAWFEEKGKGKYGGGRPRQVRLSKIPV